MTATEFGEFIGRLIVPIAIVVYLGWREYEKYKARKNYEQKQPANV